MEIKTEHEHMNLLCHGCLATDRKVGHVPAEFRNMFHALRNDDKVVMPTREIQLCWECVAFLKKMRIFKERIKTAERLLVMYLQNYYTKNVYTNPQCLSSLKKKHINTYTFEFHEEERLLEDSTNDNVEKKDNEKRIETELISEIKLECNENIKEEYNYSNDNDSEYYDTELKIEKDDIANSTKMKKKDKRQKDNKTYKRYENFATVTKKKDILKNDYFQYANAVCLSQMEYEAVLKRDRKYYCSRMTEMKYKCKKCNEKFLRKLDLLRHRSFKHIEETTFPNKCSACTTTVSSPEHLEAHWTDSHTNMLRCTLCTESYHTRPEFKHHFYRQHTKNYACKECGLEFGALPEFKKHYKQMHKNVICDYCKGSFSKKISLLCHMRRHHIPAYCKICDRAYTNQKSFKYHNMVTHPELTSGETCKELSYCVECDKQYPSIFKYRRHLQQSPRHTQQKKIRVPCPECGKVFTRTNFMRNHFRLVHLKVTKNHCEQCDKYYATGYGLRQHIARFHKKIAQPKDKYCDICGRGFGTNKILENHRRTHTGERPFKCKYCPAAFAQKTAMNTHQKSQHKNLDMNR